MITVFTPFQRKENIPFLSKVLEGKANWTVLIDDPSLKDLFPSWVKVLLFDKPPEGICKPNWLVNEFIGTEVRKKENLETQFMILCDDDSVGAGFFEMIPDRDVVCVSMTRGYDTLIAAKENMRIARMGGEQIIIKGKILRDFRYGLSVVGDGEMIEKIREEYEPVFIPEAYVIFNYFKDGWYQSFRRKPLVMFVGDYFCAGQPAMGKSEWEGNIAHSLDSTGLADVLTFHFDKYYYHTGKRGDSALVERLDELKPDYVVLIIYKEFGKDPAVMVENTLRLIKMMGYKVITIWGDLEAEQQRQIAKTVEPYCYKMIGTANKSVVESLGYTYLHVPKDPRVFCGGDRNRDIDVVFSGSYGLGREERQEALKHLINNGVNLICGGSEGRDHFSTEEYAERYKRAKISLSFSKAHGMNVVNARPFEVMLCGSLLLEQQSDELAKLYTPGEDYVEWTTLDDLLSKVRYYLEHDEERSRIAHNGQKKTENLYSAQSFWSNVLDK